jgi:cysteine desulfurase
MIYFDNNATTRVDPSVVEEMRPFFCELYGNPSAGYRFAKQVREAIETARFRVAEFIGAEPSEIVFTSCGTESNNAAIASALRAQPGKRHVITSAVEHSAVLKYCAARSVDGVETTVLPVDGEGRFSLDALETALRPDTALVTLMFANNETGVLSPAFEAAEMLRGRGVFFHTDAVNAAGKVPIDVAGSGVHFLSLSGHKFHAPKGVGILYVNSGVRFEPLFIGGGQEGGRRSGTEAVPNIVALGKAAALARDFLADGGGAQLAAMRDHFESEVMARVPGVVRNGSVEHRLPNTAHLSFEGIDAGEMLLLFDQRDFYCSSGSACSTGKANPSHVMLAMGHSEERARSSLRFSLSRYNTKAEVDAAIGLVVKAAEKLRSLRSPGVVAGG